jgi:hypothetical protein
MKKELKNQYYFQIIFFRIFYLGREEVHVKLCR